jgi:hypothetical protein
MESTTYEQAKKNADAYKRIGQTRIYLTRHEDAPYEKATKVEAGGLHRIDLAVSAVFSFEEDGLKYEWHWDLEKQEANGKGIYQIDCESCRNVMKRLKGDARIQFREYLRDCATKVKKKGEEWMTYANQQLTDAAILRDLAAQR